MNILTDEEYKLRKYDDLHQIKKGDKLGIDAQAGCPCTGGASYRLTEEVTEVTNDVVITNKGQYCRKSGVSVAPPWAYEIAWWIPTEK